MNTSAALRLQLRMTLFGPTPDDLGAALPLQDTG